jgi:hypothetical protein
MSDIGQAVAAVLWFWAVVVALAGVAVGLTLAWIF